MSKSATCPHCGSKNVYGMSRVVGYFSRIDNWNPSKSAEFKDRQNGIYDVPEDASCGCELKKEVMSR